MFDCRGLTLSSKLSRHPGHVMLPARPDSDPGIHLQPSGPPGVPHSASVPGRPRSRPRNTEDRAKPGQAAAATTNTCVIVPH